MAYAASAFYSEVEAAISVWAALYFVGGNPAVDRSGEGVAARDLVAAVALGFAVVGDEEDSAEVAGEAADRGDLGEDFGAVDPVADFEGFGRGVDDDERGAQCGGLFAETGVVERIGEVEGFSDEVEGACGLWLVACGLLGCGG